MPYLIQNPETPNSEVHELRFGSNTIGRELDNTIVVIHKSLSRYHVQIINNDHGVIITDLGSLNHTYVNETYIEQCQLNDGDLIRCGSVIFRFQQTLTITQKEPLNDPESPLSVIKRFSPQQSHIKMQDLLHQHSGEHRGTALRVRQKESNQRNLDKLKILLEVSKQLSSPQEPEQLPAKILDLLFEIMNVERAVVLLVNQANEELVSKAVKFKDGIPIDHQFYSRTITNSVQENGNALLISDAQIDQRFTNSQSVIKHTVHAAMCVPLKVNKVFGVLYVDNLSLSNVYSEEDLEFLIALANQAAIAIDNTELNKKLEAAAIMQSKFERFFPKTVSRKLREEGNIEVIDTEVTALFSDISGFTELCSEMEPRQVIEMLNEYFPVVVEEIIFQYEGTLEKYIGDALLAVWGAPYRQADDASRAVHAAIAMQRAIHKLNKQWLVQRQIEIRVQIGLNTGKVAAGNIGSPKLVQYATIGDTTNVSSRICSVAKPGEILISETTFQQLDDSSFTFEKIVPVRVKGKDEPLQLYRLLWDI